MEENVAVLKTKCETQSISDRNGPFSELTFFDHLMYFSEIKPYKSNNAKREPTSIEEVLYVEFCESAKSTTTSKTTTKKATTTTKKDIESSASQSQFFLAFICLFITLLYL